MTFMYNLIKNDNVDQAFLPINSYKDLAAYCGKVVSFRSRNYAHSDPRKSYYGIVGMVLTDFHSTDLSMPEGSTSKENLGYEFYVLIDKEYKTFKYCINQDYINQLKQTNDYFEIRLVTCREKELIKKDLNAGDKIFSGMSNKDALLSLYYTGDNEIDQYIDANANFDDLAAIKQAYSRGIDILRTKETYKLFKKNCTNLEHLIKDVSPIFIIFVGITPLEIAIKESQTSQTNIYIAGALMRAFPSLKVIDFKCSNCLRVNIHNQVLGNGIILIDHMFFHHQFDIDAILSLLQVMITCKVNSVKNLLKSSSNE